MNDYNSQDWIKEPEIVAGISVSLLYLVSFIIYLFKLFFFNMRMKNEGLTDKLVNKVDILNTAERILDEGGQRYIVGAVLFILAFIVVVIVLMYLEHRSDIKGISWFIVASFVVVSLLLFIWLWNMINVPALRAFMVLAGSVGIVSALIGETN
ncbi:hypothetical protein HUK49_09265 [Limosilactobacillus sp. c11Ua_112_M]|uniref:hypothetical protein n=1 Tax=Limosilactobacillus TaxID=2742598 RepID=UPI001782AEF2|nr:MULTISPECIES: hypothetical protein [Limosilactobacillus]MBD8088096.1 hypothetical protein [Limosilactobacillus portuensis]MEC4742620.1 hypothetical protein [Limosilactobacillus sp. c10Ua_36]